MRSDLYTFLSCPYLEQLTVDRDPDAGWPFDGLAREQRLNGDEQPFRAEAVAAGPARHERRGPADERFDRLAQLGAPWGEGVQDRRALFGQPGRSEASLGSASLARIWPA
jgi:hypothetical protein